MRGNGGGNSGPWGGDSQLGTISAGSSNGPGGTRDWQWDLVVAARITIYTLGAGG